MAGPGKNRLDGDKPATKRVRSMTLYDRLEDARERRKEALAGKVIDDAKPAAKSTTKPKSAPPPQPQASIKPAPIKPEEPASQRPPARRRLLMWLIAALIVGGGLLFAYGPDGRPDAPPIAVTSPEAEQIDNAIAASEPTPVNPMPAAESPLQAPKTAAPGITQPAAPGRTPTLPSALEPYFLTWKPGPYSESAPDTPQFALDTDDPGPPSVPPSMLNAAPPQRPDTLTANTTEDSVAPEAPIPDSARFDIVLHFPNRVGLEEAEELAASAARAGFRIEKLRPAGFSISSTNVRYFHDEDREAASLLAEAVGGELRDFTNFRPPPATGVIEIYMAGRGTTPSRNQSGLAEDLERLQRGIQQAIESISGN